MRAARCDRLLLALLVGPLAAACTMELCPRHAVCCGPPRTCVHLPSRQHPHQALLAPRGVQPDATSTTTARGSSSTTGVRGWWHRCLRPLQLAEGDRGSRGWTAVAAEKQCQLTYSCVLGVWEPSKILSRPLAL